MTRSLITIIGLAGLAACSSTTSTQVDAGTGADAKPADSGGVPDSGSIPDGGPVEPVMHGGTSGGPLNGALTVFLFDPDNQPIARATVVVVLPSGDQLTQMSDASGRADFMSSGLKSATPPVIHIFASRFRYHTIMGLGARAHTLVLESTIAQPTPRIATISGTVDGWDILPPPTEMNQVHFGQVFPVTKSLFGTNGIAQDKRVGTDVDTNIAVEGFFPDFLIKVDADNTRGLGVLGGLIAIGGMNPTVRISHLGILPDLMAPPGSVVSGQHLRFSHAIDQPLAVRVASFPELHDKSILAVLEMAQGGYLPFSIPKGTHSGTAAIDAPGLSGALAGATYTVVGIASEPDGTKSSFAVSRGNSMPNIMIGALLAPPATATANGRTIQITFPRGANFNDLSIEQDGISRWSVTAFSRQGGAEAPSSFTLPAVPPGSADPLSGMMTIVATSAEVQTADFDNFKIDDLEAKVRALAMSRSGASF